MLDFPKLSADYQQALLRQVVPFWLKHGRDELCGGYFDLLSATGQAIEGDKFVALQAQQTWTFAWLYNSFDGQPTWLAHARHGATFLRQFAHDDDLTCYARLDRRGKPVAPALDVVPDCYAVMAYEQLHRATRDDEWATLAKQTFSNLLQRRQAIRVGQAGTIGGFRELRHLSEPVAVLKAVLAMQPMLDEDPWKEAVDAVSHELLTEFLDRRTDTLREFIMPDGAFVNTPDGRRLNVGLSCQTAGYLLDLYTRSSPSGAGTRKATIQVVTWCLRICEQAWDELTGGLNQFIDLKNQPVIFPDWQQKWAWVQVEALTTLVKGYFYTRHPDCLKWFKRIHDYTFQHFPDPKQGGWHLALDGQKQPVAQAKATASVGCFSLIRGLVETAQTLTKCGQPQPVGRNVRVV